MSKSFLINTIVLLLVIAFISIGILVEKNNIPEVQEQQVQCEHEFVVTSRYNILFSRYKTFSKCIKCGLEV